MPTSTGAPGPLKDVASVHLQEEAAFRPLDDLYARDKVGEGASGFTTDMSAWPPRGSLGMGGSSSTCPRLVIYLSCGASQTSKMWAAGKGHCPAPASPPTPGREHTHVLAAFPLSALRRATLPSVLCAFPFTFQVLPSVLFISPFRQSCLLAFSLTFPHVLHTVHFLILSCPPFSLLVPIFSLCPVLIPVFPSLSSSPPVLSGPPPAPSLHLLPAPSRVPAGAAHCQSGPILNTSFPKTLKNKIRQT